MIRFARTLLAASALVAAALPAPAAESSVTVAIDQTRVLRLDRPAAVVVVGNPSIADATLTDSGTAFIMGKTFGVTNVIALDAQGNEIVNARIVVTSSGARTVTVVRGNQQFTYACAGRCERVMMPGDNTDAFKGLAEQVSTKAEQGTGAQEAASSPSE